MILSHTKIEWVKNPDGSKGYVWNPAWGCQSNCDYCYARKMAKRFGDPNFKPTWKQKNFDKSFPKKPSRIFVNSMSDICWWPWDWMESVLKKIADNPIHTFLFLTKVPASYSDNFFPYYSCWLGTTITNQSMMNHYADLIFETTGDVTNKIFFSFEPLLERIRLYVNPDWVIIGAETGNRKGKVIPRREWIAEIVDYCKTNQIPVFLKDSLREIWGEELIQEYPK